MLRKLYRLCRPCLLFIATASTPIALPGQQSADGLQHLLPPNPTPASFISDAPKVLSQAAHDEVDSKIRELQSGGFGDVAIAILANIGDYSPNQVSVAIYRDWKVGSVAAIGSAHRNIGVLILIVPKELSPDKKGQCYILTGTGSEGIITDAASGVICRDVIIPLLKEKDYRGALLAGIDAIGARLRGDEGLAGDSGAAEAVDDNTVSERHGDAKWLFFPGGLLTILLGVIGGRRWQRNRTRKCPKCGKLMVRLGEAEDDANLAPGQKIEEEIKSIDYDVWACTCGEHLVIPYRKLFTRYSKCRECGNRTASSTRRVIIPASTISSGLAEDSYSCKACPAHWKQKVVLPRIQSSSSSSSGGSGGGGSSFGGSGSTSGGGGGGSY